jgi:phospholipid/cholesterol/gamma-HCH transport system substrate-binding protein
MPSASKTRWSQLRVGVMAIVALLILAYLVFLMAGSKGLFQTYVKIYTYLDDAASIADGAPVTLNGINIGKVTRTELSGMNTPNRIVRVTLEVNTEMLREIPVDSQAALAAANLLGTKYINIKKGKRTESIQPGGEIQSLDTREFDEVVQQGYAAIAGLNGIIQKLGAIVDQIQLGKGSIGKLLVDETIYNRALGLVDEANKLLTELHAALNSKTSTLGRILNEDDIYQDARGLVARMDMLIDGLNRGEGTAGKFLKDPALFEDVRMTIADVRELLAGINRGEGDAGKFLKSDELHEQIKGTMARVDQLLDKISNGQGTVGQLLNNPGLYESLDGTSREVQALLKDFRANPKKFLTIQLKLF